MSTNSLVPTWKIDCGIPCALALSKGMPKTVDGILKTGADISLAQVESLFAFEVTGNKPFSAKKARPNASVPGGFNSLEARYFHGEELEVEFAESYSRFRWNFPWKEFTVVGIPDGITPDTVYEFKSASNDYWLKTVSRPIAKTQADLYGMFFERPRKRV